MAYHYTEHHVGTLTCDRCGAQWSDGIAEHEHQGRGLLHRRAHETAGWHLHRPNEYQAIDLCPNCPARD